MQQDRVQHDGFRFNVRQTQQTVANLNVLNVAKEAKVRRRLQDSLTRS
jgi:hypothetical protein